MTAVVEWAVVSLCLRHCETSDDINIFTINLFTNPLANLAVLIAPARVTVIHNGLLAQFDEEIHGEAAHRVLPEYRHKVSQGPVAFGGRGCPIRFRNLWLRRL